MQHSPGVFGVDVAKAEVVAAEVDVRTPRKTVCNERKALKAWLRTLPPGSIVAMESTGSHHRLLAELAHAAGMRVFVLNARDVYFYARALGMRSKSDRVDAAVIARYAAEHRAKLHAWQPPAPVYEHALQLLRRRARVIVAQERLHQSLAEVPTLQVAKRQLDKAFARFLAKVDAQLDALVQGEPQFEQRVARLRTIAGIGPQSSVMLGALFAAHEFGNAEAVVAYSGMDPRAHDSGAKRGRRRLSKRGPGWLRRQLWLAAFGASHSKALGPLYRAIKAKGFEPTQALVILARKLLRVAWAMWNSGKPFEPTRVGQPAKQAP